MTTSNPPHEATKRPLLGALLLLTAAVIWGFAFVPQRLTVVTLPPLTATAIRFAVAAPLALVVALPRLKRPLVGWRPAALLGALLVVMYVLQTAALVTAPVARVSLITGMYAVFVPLFAPLLGHARPTGAHWLGALLALAGLLGLTGVVGDKSALSAPLNVGDGLVLLHALLSAFQVLLVGKLARDADVVVLNAVQLGTVALLCIPAALVVDGWPDLPAIDGRTWLSFLYLAAFSTVVAFVCQIVGQRHTSAPTAAVIMLLETPVGVLGALLFLDEQMGWTQWLGAVVLVGGVVVSLSKELVKSRA
jgi:drug/metabolite transporter (DMT)-like permease